MIVSDKIPETKPLRVTSTLHESGMARSQNSVSSTIVKDILLKRSNYEKKIDEDYEKSVELLFKATPNHTKSSPSSQFSSSASRIIVTRLSSTEHSIVMSSPASSHLEYLTPAPLFDCNISQLNPDIELRKRFGASPKAAGASNSNSNPPRARGALGRSVNFSGGANRYAYRATQQARRKEASLVPHVKHIQSPPKLFQLLPGIQLPSGEVLTSHSNPSEYNILSNGRMVYYISPNSTYLQLYHRFQRVIQSYDHRALVTFVHENPPIPEALLRLSELHEYSNEFEKAIQLVEQALFLYESALPSDFSLTSTSITVNGNERALVGCSIAALHNHMDRDPSSFSNVSNALARTFVDLLARHSKLLLKKACPVTAFQNALLSFSLFSNPVIAPLNATSSIGSTLSSSSSASPPKRPFSDPQENAQKLKITAKLNTKLDECSFLVDQKCFYHHIDYAAFRAGQDVFLTKVFLTSSPKISQEIFSPVPNISDSKMLKAAITKSTNFLTSFFDNTPGCLQGTMTIIRASHLPNWSLSSALSLRRLENLATEQALDHDGETISSKSTSTAEISVLSSSPRARKMSETATSEDTPLSLDISSDVDNFIQISVPHSDISKAERVDRSAKHCLRIQSPSSMHLLERAIVLFPLAIVNLIREMHENTIPSAWQAIIDRLGEWDYSNPRLNSFASSSAKPMIDRLGFIYAKRMSSIWKQDQNMDFLKQACHNVIRKFDKGLLSSNLRLYLQYYYAVVMDEMNISESVLQLELADYSNETSSINITQIQQAQAQAQAQTQAQARTPFGGMAATLASFLQGLQGHEHEEEILHLLETETAMIQDESEDEYDYDAPLTFSTTAAGQTEIGSHSDANDEDEDEDESTDYFDEPTPLD